MEDLQSILEKINREGVEKAEARAKTIETEARARAEDIVKNARDEAEKARAKAEKSAAEYSERAKETIAQAARDTVLQIKDAVTKLLEDLLVKEVNKALADDATAAELVKDAIKGLTGPGEIACSAKLAQSLAARLAASGAFTVVTDNFKGTGFTVKTDGGRVEHAFTGDVIAAELAKRLRPDLAALLK